MQCNFIDDINSIEQNRVIKCCGVVLSITPETNFFSFIFNDNSGSAEGTIYENELVYKELDLPKLNDSVLVLGFGSKKELKKGEGITNYILKIKILRFKIITIEEQFRILEKAITCKREKLQLDKLQGNTQTIKMKNSLLKELKKHIEPLEIRSLALCCLYITLESNIDLNSYTFSHYTIRKHRLTKNFLESKKLREECLIHLDEFIEGALQFFVSKNFIDKKDPMDGIKIYKIERKIFIDIQLQALNIINEKRSKGGATLTEILRKINNNLGFYDDKNCAFNDKLIQTILKKFIEQNKIYKTHDKMLLPNN